MMKHEHRCSVVNQVVCAMIRDRAFDATLSSPPHFTWTPYAVVQVLRAVPSFFIFPKSSSIGRQSNSIRHRPPPQQRRLFLEHQHGFFPARRHPSLILFWLSKSTQFYHWLHLHSGFTHDHTTVKHMALLLAKSNHLPLLWDFLQDLVVYTPTLVTTPTLTSLIKCLAEDGLVKEASCFFYRIKLFNCHPDVHAYNTLMFAFCRVGLFDKARHLLSKMLLPGFSCPPDAFTYTLLINAFCKHSMNTTCSKAIRRRMWEANHMFRQMLFHGILPDTVTYNALIDACCKTNRIDRALELFQDMHKRGCLPNRVTYDSLIRYYSAEKKVGNAIKVLRRMQEKSHGTPSTSSYTPIIHALCQTGKPVKALSFLVELFQGGFIPREYTYKLVSDALFYQGKAHLLDDTTRNKIQDGIILRYRQRRIAKPVMSRKNYPLPIEEFNEPSLNNPL